MLSIHIFHSASFLLLLLLLYCFQILHYKCSFQVVLVYDEKNTDLLARKLAVLISEFK